MKKQLFDDLVASVHEAGRIHRGEAKPSHDLGHGEASLSEGKAFGFRDELRPAGDGTLRVLARIRVLSTEEGGRTRPFRAKYRPNHNFGDAENRNFFIGQIEIPDGEWVHPGETRDVAITFFNVVGLAEKLTPGRVWRIQEGPHLVAIGEILSAL